MSGETSESPVETTSKGMPWIAWILVGMCVVGYYYIFRGVWYLLSAGSLYDAALGGEYNPTIKILRGFLIVCCLPLLAITVAMMKVNYRWVTGVMLVIGVGILGAACWLSDYSGTNHSPAFLRGIGDRMIQRGDIAALKIVAAEKAADPLKGLGEERRESLKGVFKLMPEFSLDPVEGRADVLIVTYGRIFHVMVGPDDLQTPVGWDAKRAVKVAPGVFLIGGENEW